jgi:hypothetical protein
VKKIRGRPQAAKHRPQLVTETLFRYPFSMIPYFCRRFSRFLLLATLGMAPTLQAQLPECRPFLEGPRLPLQGSDNALRTGATTLSDECVQVSVFGVTIPTMTVSYRSAYPFDRDDGSRWTGRGLTTAFTAGGRFEAGPLRVVLDPAVSYQQNRDFTLVGNRGFRYPYHTLDWPQQPGRGSFWTFAPGQSMIALQAGAAEVALSTENLWWGPARRYPILLSNSAPGFIHMRLGTSRAVDLGFAKLDLDILWGRLDESGQFDAIQDNDHRLFTGVFLELRPAFAPGLSLGIAGVQHNRWDEAGRLFLNLFTFPFNEEESTVGNGLLSFQASWQLKESEADFYAEWAREDFWLNADDLLSEIDHSQGYLLGFEKIVRGSSTPLRISGELIHLGASPTFQSRGQTKGRVSFYEHGLVPQGHTNRGQLLGAAIGPGSDAQYLAAELLFDRRTLGIYLERIRRDEDAYFDRFVHIYAFRGHDIEWTAGLMGEETAGQMRIQWESALSRRKNRNFIGLDGVNWDFLRETNLAVTMRAWWQPEAER